MAGQHQPQPVCSLNEWVVLAVLAEQPTHGFAMAKQLAPDSDLGRILTVRRPQVYRAIDRLVDQRLISPFQVEPGDAGPTRTVHRVTQAGERASRRWLLEPVNHVRDLRVEFLIKLRLLERSDLPAGQLIEAQRAALGDTLQRLMAKLPEPSAGGTAPGEVDVAAGGTALDRVSVDVVDRWRAHSANAAWAFLEGLTD